MFLSSGQIKQSIISGSLDITPFSDELLKQASYNFTLDNTLVNPVTKESIPITAEGYILEPNAFMIGKTRENINLKGSYICILGTRSSVAQQGIDVLQSSSIAEPDTKGQFTLEITNRSTEGILLFPGMRIVKGIFSPITS